MITYDRYQLICLITEFLNNGNLVRSIKKQVWFNDLLSYFNYLSLPEDWNLQRKLWHFFKNTSDVPKCPISNLDRKWRSGDYIDKINLPKMYQGYSYYANKTIAAQQLVIKSKNTIKEKYGVDNVFELNFVKEKSKNTIKEKYGVDNISKLNDIKEKKEQTMLKNYGRKSNFGENSEAMYKKYGVVHNSHIPEIAEIMCFNRFKNRKYIILESGEKIALQGYEHFGFYFLKIKYLEKDIIYKKSLMPKFLYKNGTKQHRYYPDFYIKKDDLIVEIKSEYTYEKDFEILKLKYNSVIQNGYKFLLLIFNSTGYLLFESQSIFR